ncbi:hypothetical protein [Massilia genomosp. 1]|uniref:Uncharacterized protein n=1 Tax=Massilia genomosp. 1 TaxID=2609280 RepID=A0ABX0N2B0_9BURK|nr:hypothetical protein [Massilia genomosp. 1]NHZ66763.1 hypothetical protein [Massilia genomosp. 1]
MEKIFDESTWDTYISGYTFYDCAILSEHGFGFVLVEEKDGDDDDDSAPMTRFIAMKIDNPIESRFNGSETNGFSKTTIASSEHSRGYVAVDTGSKVYSIDSERMGDERAIDRVLDMSTYNGMVGVIHKVVRAAGQVYALGDFRRIYRRIGVDQWIELGAEGAGVPMPAEIPSSSDYDSSIGFNDMSAFAKNDMYAVGGDGDVWRFDGKKWHNCPIPTNASLETVCCAGNGIVYITELNGSVWAGRTDQWKKIADANLTAGFHPVDAFWFNNRLYLGSQQGIFAIDEKTKKVVPLKEVDEDAPNPTNGGRIDVSPDGRFLLTVGPYGACLHDGTKWRRLFSAFDFVEG